MLKVEEEYERGSAEHRRMCSIKEERRIVAQRRWKTINMTWKKEETKEKETGGGGDEGREEGGGGDGGAGDEKIKRSGKATTKSN